MLPEPTPAPFRCDHSLRAASAALFRAASSSSSFRFAAISSSISSSLYPLVSYSSLQGRGAGGVGGPPVLRCSATAAGPEARAALCGRHISGTRHMQSLETRTAAARPCLISTSFTSISRRRLWSTISSLGARAMARSTFESLLIWCDSWRRRRLNLFVCEGRGSTHWFSPCASPPGDTRAPFRCRSQESRNQHLLTASSLQAGHEARLHIARRPRPANGRQTDAVVHLAATKDRPARRSRKTVSWTPPRSRPRASSAWRPFTPACRGPREAPTPSQPLRAPPLRDRGNEAPGAGPQRAKWPRSVVVAPCALVQRCTASPTTSPTSPHEVMGYCCR